MQWVYFFLCGCFGRCILNQESVKPRWYPFAVKSVALPLWVCIPTIFVLVKYWLAYFTLSHCQFPQSRQTLRPFVGLHSFLQQGQNSVVSGYSPFSVNSSHHTRGCSGQISSSALCSNTVLEPALRNTGIMLYSFLFCALCALFCSEPTLSRWQFLATRGMFTKCLTNRYRPVTFFHDVKLSCSTNFQGMRCK